MTFLQGAAQAEAPAQTAREAGSEVQKAAGARWKSVPRHQGSPRGPSSAEARSEHITHLYEMHK